MQLESSLVKLAVWITRRGMVFYHTEYRVSIDLGSGSGVTSVKEIGL